jgi:hypothetical protein
VEYANLHRAMTAFFNARERGPDTEGLADVTLLDRLARSVDEGKEEILALTKGDREAGYKQYLKDREKFRTAARDIFVPKPGRTGL